MMAGRAPAFLERPAQDGSSRDRQPDHRLLPVGARAGAGYRGSVCADRGAEVRGLDAVAGVSLALPDERGGGFIVGIRRR